MVKIKTVKPAYPVVCGVDAHSAATYIPGASYFKVG
jgi:hypothetical protein